ncbi:MAG: energy transducer TonB [Pyrinomonadaceae bacterium]|nr:energy transducer TonB [Pyrinomonadaceae bacterium]
MFDNLVESSGSHADTKHRSRYFVVSTLVVGVFFLTAVVASLYAADIGIGDDSLDLTRLVAPMIVDAPEPERNDPQPLAASPKNNLPTRTANIARIEESQFVPDKVSTERSNAVARPDRPFVLDKYNIDPPRSPSVNTNLVGSSSVPGSSNNGSRLGDEGPTSVANTPPPPPARRPDPPVKTLGVVNGMAIHLPQPPYPPAAVALGLSGEVTVQITIDESGRVISSKAVNGNPIFRQHAERAAKSAKFSPTFLSNQAVKATGMIIYRFKRN